MVTAVAHPYGELKLFFKQDSDNVLVVTAVAHPYGELKHDTAITCIIVHMVTAVAHPYGELTTQSSRLQAAFYPLAGCFSIWRHIKD